MAAHGGPSSKTLIAPTRGPFQSIVLCQRYCVVDSTASLLAPLTCRECPRVLIFYIVQASASTSLFRRFIAEYEMFLCVVVDLFCRSFGSAAVCVALFFVISRK